MSFMKNCKLVKQLKFQCVEKVQEKKAISPNLIPEENREKLYNDAIKKRNTKNPR